MKFSLQLDEKNQDLHKALSALEVPANVIRDDVDPMADWKPWAGA